MKIVAVLTTLWCISWLLNAILMITAPPSEGKSGAQLAFIILSIIVNLPQLFPAALLIRWLVKDSLESRNGVVLAYKAAIICAFVAGGWAVVGAFIILRYPYHVYILRNYHAMWGYNDEGNCIDDTMCDPEVNLTAIVNGV